MIVYHGSTIVVDNPIAAAGRERLDFGKGFYITNIQDQAEAWAKRMHRIRQKPGIVNVYELDMDLIKNKFRYLGFNNYDNEWLQFIISNRTGLCAESFDVIEGGVANDRVVDTIEAYMANLMPLDLALKELSKHKPNNQICILSQKAIDSCLHFVKHYNI